MDDRSIWQISREISARLTLYKKDDLPENLSLIVDDGYKGGKTSPVVISRLFNISIDVFQLTFSY